MEATPDRTGDGPIDRDVTYTLSATNACGGTATRTATLHVVGSIDPAPPVTLASLFYPTAYPERRHPNVGLVSSQETDACQGWRPLSRTTNSTTRKNKLMVVGHADVRGPEKYNRGAERTARGSSEELPGFPGNRRGQN